MRRLRYPLALLGGLACAGGDPGPSSTVADVVVAPAGPVALLQGDTLRLLATARDAAGAALTGIAFGFESSNGAVLTVSPAGLVTATGPGQAFVTVRAGTRTATAAFTVTGHPGLGAVATVVAPGHPRGVAITPRGEIYVAFLDSSTIRRLDLTLLQLTPAFMTTPTPRAVDVTRSGGRAYAAGGAVEEIDVISHQRRRQYNGPDWIRALMAVGSRLLVVSTSGGYVRFDSTTLTPVRTVAIAGALHAATLARGDSVLAVVRCCPGALVLALAAADTVLATVPLGGTPRTVVAAPDGSRLFVTYDDRAILEVRSPVSGAVLDSIGVPAGALDVAFAPDGARAYLAGPGGQLNVVHLDTRSLGPGLNLGGAPQRIAVGPLGAYLIVTDQTGFVRIVR